MRHFVIAGALVLLVAFATYFGLTSLGLMPVAASAQAGSFSQVGSIDWLWNLQVIAISFLFSLIVVPMAYSLVVFRRKKGDTTDAEHIEGNTTLEITWTVIPLFIVLMFAYFGAFSLREVNRLDPNAMEINVTGFQWAWKFEYPQYGVVSKELYLPVNKQILLKMQSSDVIHSFWVPEFRVKQDVVPGRVTEYRVTPTLKGEYKVRCAEICGTSHAYMENPVMVVEQAEFERWIADMQAQAAAAQTPADKGKLLVAANGCTGCHSLTSTPLPNAPAWFGLFGSQVKLSDGSTVKADEAFIAESILKPSAKIVAGYESASPMPLYNFTEEEAMNIVEYIKTLR